MIALYFDMAIISPIKTSHVRNRKVYDERAQHGIRWIVMIYLGQLASCSKIMKSFISLRPLVGHVPSTDPTHTSHDQGSFCHSTMHTFIDKEKANQKKTKNYVFCHTLPYHLC